MATTKTISSEEGEVLKSIYQEHVLNRIQTQPLLKYVKSV